MRPTWAASTNSVWDDAAREAIKDYNLKDLGI